MTITELIKEVKHWSLTKKLDEQDPKIQTLKLMEEVGELAEALLKNNTLALIDALGDIQVVLIILHQQLGWELEQTLQYAYNQIKERKGEIIKGVFVKEEDI